MDEGRRFRRARAACRWALARYLAAEHRRRWHRFMSETDPFADGEPAPLPSAGSLSAGAWE